MRSILVLLAVLCAVPGWAQSRESAYLATRDQTSADLKQKAQREENDPSQKIGRPEYFSPGFRAEIARARRGLEAQLRDVLGPLPGLPGFPRAGTLNAAPCCYGRFGALDGLAFETASGERMIVSTEALLQRWLKESSDFWTVDAKPSSEPGILFLVPDFYRWAGATDWPVRKVADLPIGLPTGASAVGAFLASGGSGATPDWIAVAVVKRGRVFVTFMRARTKAMPIAVCDTVAPDAYRDCWARHAKEQPWFADLLLETVVFVEALPE